MIDSIWKEGANDGREPSGHYAISFILSAITVHGVCDVCTLYGEMPRVLCPIRFAVG